MTGPQPYDFAEARDAQNAAKVAQRGAEQILRDAAIDLAGKRGRYEEAKAIKLTELRAEGEAATLALDLAKGDPHVSKLRYERDVAEGVYEAAKSALWRHSADRRALEQLVNWSMRRELAENGGRDDIGSEAAATGTFGGVRAV